MPLVIVQANTVWLLTFIEIVCIRNNLDRSSNELPRRKRTEYQPARLAGNTHLSRYAVLSGFVQLTNSNALRF